MTPAQQHATTALLIIAPMIVGIWLASRDNRRWRDYVEQRRNDHGQGVA